MNHDRAYAGFDAGGTSVALIALLLSAPTLHAWYDGALGTQSVLIRCLVAVMAAWSVVSLMMRLVNGYSTGSGPERPHRASHGPTTVDATGRPDAQDTSDPEDEVRDAEELQGAVAIA